MTGDDYRNGDVIISRRDDGAAIIDRADPKTLITAEMVDAVRAGRCEPWARLDGDVLTLEGVNRRVVYRIDFDSYSYDTYRMQWPD